MKNFNLFFKSLSLIAAIIAMSACGSKSAINASSGLTGGGTGGGTTTPTPGAGGGNIYGLPPAIQQTVQMSGATGPSPTWSTTLTSETTLKIKISPLQAPNITVTGYQNAVFAYGCMAVQVTVNGSTQTTKSACRPRHPTRSCVRERPRLPSFRFLKCDDGFRTGEHHHS